mmetsp:Transcript_33271/g.77857  ORF Transcript_33271/g.77857 Transcript_33271/m.77857 type:complete len:242 (+) Transcript_33271:292-1017(+)
MRAKRTAKTPQKRGEASEPSFSPNSAAMSRGREKAGSAEETGRREGLASSASPMMMVVATLTAHPMSEGAHPSAFSSSPNLSFTLYEGSNAMPRVVPSPSSIPASTASPRRPLQCSPSQTEGATWMGVAACSEKRLERFQGGVARMDWTPRRTPTASPIIPMVLANTTWVCCEAPGLTYGRKKSLSHIVPKAIMQLSAVDMKAQTAALIIRADANCPVVFASLTTPATLAKMAFGGGVSTK